MASREPQIHHWPNHTPGLGAASPGSSIRAGSILGHIVPQLGLVRRIVEHEP